MYGFPHDLDLHDILGSEIQQICLHDTFAQFESPQIYPEMIIV